MGNLQLVSKPHEESGPVNGPVNGPVRGPVNGPVRGPVPVIVCIHGQIYTDIKECYSGLRGSYACGYVLVPQGHPWYAALENADMFAAADCVDEALNVYEGSDPKFAGATFSAVTFADFETIGQKRYARIGFDTNHTGDADIIRCRYNGSASLYAHDILSTYVQLAARCVVLK